MPRPTRLFLPALLLGAALAVAGCESSDQRAERHFNSGVALIEAGQTSQAMLEFRNVLRLQPGNIEARLHIARLHREAGETPQAYREFLQVAERDPDVLEARIALAQIAADANNWDELERHGTAAARLAPDDPQVRLIGAVLDYRTAMLARDRSAAAAPAETVAALIGDQPDNATAWRLLIDNALDGGNDPEAGLARIEEALEHLPGEAEFHRLRLQALMLLDRPEAMTAALQEMIEALPDDTEPGQLFVAWMVQQGQMDAALAHLRARADSETVTDTDRLMLIDFLRQTEGDAAALDELDRLIARSPEVTTLQALRATQLHEMGETATAIGDLQGLLAEAEAGDDTDDLRVLLARLLMFSGDAETARSHVDTVLERDSGHVDALKMRAAWMIDEDRPTEAINVLRQAQAGAPRDPSIMVLMGQAHEREGSRDLAGERFAQAVEMSGEAARESIVYARHLLGEDRIDAAESVLVSALRRNPANLELFRLTMEVQLRRGEWDRVQRGIWQLRAMDTPETERLANAVEADLMLRQGRTVDTIGYLEGLLRDGDEGTGTVAALVQTQVMEGEYDGALEILEDRLAGNPGDPVLRFLRAGLHVLADEVDTAEASYRRLVEEFPNAEPPLRALYALLQAQGRDDDAEALIDQVIAASDNALMPRLLRAARLERIWDIEGAIAVYEDLYSADSSNMVVANNLASLISAHRDDEASVERAFAIARRLRGTDVPAFQDTYGWIQYRRGFYDEALSYLEPAAEGLPNDPLVQFHLGMTYHALGRLPEARDRLARAVELAGDAPLPQFDQARALLDELGSL